MALQQFDELSNLSTEAKLIDYEKYFDDKCLTKTQKEERIAFSKEMENIMLFAFSLILILTSEKNYDYAIVTESIVEKYQQLIKKYTNVDDYLKEYSKEFGKEITTSTIDNLVTAYFLSRERASAIAVNEADNILNRKDYINAVGNGKTKKQWVDVRDKRERESHLKVGGTIIGINELFKVGNSVMRFPHDTEFCDDAKELVRCRCRIQYL